MDDAFAVCVGPRAVVAAKKAEIEMSEQAALIASTNKRRADEEETAAKEAVKKRKLSADQKRDALNQELQILDTEQQTLVSKGTKSSEATAEDATKSDVVRTQKAGMKLLVVSLEKLEKAAKAVDEAGKKTATIAAEKAQLTRKYDQAMSEGQTVRTAREKATSAFDALQVPPSFPH